MEGGFSTLISSVKEIIGRVIVFGTKIYRTELTMAKRVVTILFPHIADYIGLAIYVRKSS